MAIDLMNLQPQKISRNLKGKFSLFYGDAGEFYAHYLSN